MLGLLSLFNGKMCSDMFLHFLLPIFKYLTVQREYTVEHASYHVCASGPVRNWGYPAKVI